MSDARSRIRLNRKPITVDFKVPSLFRPVPRLVPRGVNSNGERAPLNAVLATAARLIRRGRQACPLTMDGDLLPSPGLGSGHRPVQCPQFGSAIRGAPSMLQPFRVGLGQKSPGQPSRMHGSSTPESCRSCCIAEIFCLGRVEQRRGGLGFRLGTSAPFPLPAHQTGRAGFRHPAFRLASPQAHGRTFNG